MIRDYRVDSLWKSKKSWPISQQLAAYSGEAPGHNKLGVFDEPSLISRTISGILLNASALFIQKVTYF
jgi:hypothetical protein